MRESMIKNIMIPRSKLLACPEDLSLVEITNRASISPYSRIPIYRDSIDNIVGIVHIRDLFCALNSKPVPPPSVTDLLRPVVFFPETVPVKEVFASLQTSRNQVSIILDEFGGTSGMVTLEDLIEEIFGDIQDEFDKEPPQILILGESGFLILGNTPLEEMNALMGINLEAGKIDTIGGLITYQLGRIPEVNDRVVLGGYQFTIHQMQGRAVLSIFMAATPEIIEFFRSHS